MSEAILKRIDAKVSSLLFKPAKQQETWVKASVITNMTGWNKEKMRAARNNGYVKYKKADNGFWYLMESISPKFIKSQPSIY